MEVILENYPPQVELNGSTERTIKQVTDKMAELYDLANDEVSITVTDDEYIRELNAKYRNIDRATDVLSFALNEGDEPEIIDGAAVNLLGEIIISLPTAARQAVEYGHSLEREIAFLTVHGMLHLLGYDHIEDADRQEMRGEEEYVLGELGIMRG